MGLVLNKAKRSTVSDCIFGVAILCIIINIGFYIYLPISQLVESGKYISFDQLYPLDNKLLTPLPGIALGTLLFVISYKLKKDETWLSKSYDRLGPGPLLLLLLMSVWFIIPFFGAIVEAIFIN